MGEYAKYNGDRIKIGTCETMYYLRYEDRRKVIPEEHSLDPSKIQDLFWRLPWPEEDSCVPGGYKDTGSGLPLIGFEDAETDKNPGNIQFSHPCGLLINVKCYHGHRLPAGTPEITACWNGKDPHPLELIYIKNTEEGLLPIVRCKYCHQMWRYTWDEILPYVKDTVMGARLEQYIK